MKITVEIVKTEEWKATLKSNETKKMPVLWNKPMKIDKFLARKLINFKKMRKHKYSVSEMFYKY